MLDILKPFKIKDEKQLLRFINKCKVLLPNIEKTTYRIEDGFNQDQITIDRYFRFNVHHHPANSKKRFFKTFTFGIFSEENNNKFLDMLKVTYPKPYQEKFIIEKYFKGYEVIEQDPEIYNFVGDVYALKVYKIDKLEIFTIKDKGELVYTGFLRHGLIKRFFETKKGNKCLSYLPINKESKVKFDKNLIAYGVSSFTFISSIYAYFQSGWIVVAIIIISACSLWINDFINPRRHPVINIIQAIIYAIIFAFLK
jgi:hypothetical protein